MNRKERKELASDIEDRLDNELDFDLDYEMDDYHENNTSIVDVDIDITDCDDWPEDWDEQVGSIMAEVVNDWGGWYSWDNWCVSVSIPDE